MPDRYYSEAPIEGDSAVLTGPEAHHLAHVMRAAVGGQVIVFDGRGAEFLAEVVAVRRDRVDLAVHERREIDREARRRLTLAVALPKGDRQKWLLEKAVELGVARLVPLVTERGVAQPTAAALDRLRRAVIEASKQCGRNRLMEIGEPARLADFEGDRWIAHPGIESGASQSPGPCQTDFDAPVVAAIGPEGGFTEAELATALAGGWQPVSLGPRVLRIETAALALAARLLY